MAGRRGQGEGSIYQSKDGRWRAAVDLGWEAGRRRRKVVSGRTRAEVATKLRAVQQDVDKGLPVRTDGPAPTLGQWLAAWLVAKTSAVRPSTLTRYEQIVRNNIVPGVGSVRLDRLEPEHVEALYASLLVRLRPRTVLQVHRVLSGALTLAVRRGRVARNVCLLVDAPKLEASEVTPLTGAEARALLRVAADRPHYARWLLALVLGARQGEALGLRWDRVDLDAGTLAVRNGLQRRPGVGLMSVPVKSRAGRRDLPLPAAVVSALRLVREQQAAERVAAGGRWEDTGLVFTNSLGRALDPRNDHRRWKALCRDAGVPLARLHDARHTAATTMLEMGVPARVVMEILGHSQISLTLGTYTHVTAQVAREAADLVMGRLGTDGDTRGDGQDDETGQASG